MKKYIVCISAFLLIAGMASAQVAKKQPAATSTAKITTRTKPNTSANVTPMSTTTSKPATSTAAIKRKHTHKKTTSPKKTESK